MTTTTALSPLQRLRLTYQPCLPTIFKDLPALKIQGKGTADLPSEIASFFPLLAKQPAELFFVHEDLQPHHPKKVGVLFSGGQAAGGHNVITGLYDALTLLHPESQLIGFCDGPQGLVQNKWIPLSLEKIADYRNQGGFDLVGSGRTKITTAAQFEAVEATVRAHRLDGLVIIGGDDSNSNAAWLAEFFLKNKCETKVVGVPKTIDGDLKNEDIEISFGFDTAVKTYAETIGNLKRDARSAKKSYYFIKLMGRSASHITLECALQTHPNMALIGEEVAAQKKTLTQLALEIADMICVRAEQGKSYGVILIPEGIIEFIPEFSLLIEELNALLSLRAQEFNQGSTGQQIKSIMAALSPDALRCFQTIPLEIQQQLLLDRDSHGNVQVSKIETERLFSEVVREELMKRKKEGTYTGTFSSQPHFCGYEGRSCLPSNFDAQYCYALGHLAALLIDQGATGYICCIKDLALTVGQWKIKGRNLSTMMGIETRSGKKTAVISKALVDLEGSAFHRFSTARSNWRLQDDDCMPGPIQFFGPPELVDAITDTLALGT